MTTVWKGTRGTGLNSHQTHLWVGLLVAGPHPEKPASQSLISDQAPGWADNRVASVHHTGGCSVAAGPSVWTQWYWSPESAFREPLKLLHWFFGDSPARSSYEQQGAKAEEADLKEVELFLAGLGFAKFGSVAGG